MREVWFGGGKNEKKKIADFHVLGLCFMVKKHDLSEKKNVRLSRAGGGVRLNLCHAYSLPLTS
jgi:hypothetical protein